VVGKGVGVGREGWILDTEGRWEAEAIEGTEEPDGTGRRRELDESGVWG